MAICAWCDREMRTASTCTVVAFHSNGVPHSLARHGYELWRKWRARQRCGDCNVVPGGLHHPGCDQAECPVCAGQLLSCGCTFDEDGDVTG